MPEDTDARQPARPDGIGASFQGTLEAMDVQELTPIDRCRRTRAAREAGGAEQDLLSGWRVTRPRHESIRSPGQAFPLADPTQVLDEHRASIATSASWASHLYT